MQQPDYSISTPENVDLHLELAGVGNRVLACLIDSMITYGVILVIAGLVWAAYTMVNLMDLSDNLRSTLGGVCGMVGIFLAFCVTFGYYIFFEGTWQGQTPGKKLVNIRVIELNGQPITWSAVLLRNLIRTFDTGLAFIGLIPMIADRNERRFGDYAAGTIVIRERKPDLLKDEFLIKDTYNTESIDVGRITPQEYDLLVSFLKRREFMAKSQRPLVAAQLTNYLKEKLNDSSTEPAEKFLERVYAAYKARAS